MKSTKAFRFRNASPALTAVLGIIALAIAFPDHTALADAICGNGIIEAAEDCDDGGTCIGGTNAGTHCTAESECRGNGVCIGGSKRETACAAAGDCPGGSCVHCVPQGGDGCAANCTNAFEVFVASTRCE